MPSEFESNKKAAISNSNTGQRMGVIGGFIHRILGLQTTDIPNSHENAESLEAGVKKIDVFLQDQSPSTGTSVSNNPNTSNEIAPQYRHIQKRQADQLIAEIKKINTDQPSDPKKLETSPIAPKVPNK